MDLQVGEAFSNTQACQRAIEREKGDMARDSRGRNHGAGTTGRGSRKPTSILTRVRERSRVNADPEARGRERGGGGSSQAWREGALQACALRAQRVASRREAFANMQACDRERKPGCVARLLKPQTPINPKPLNPKP